MENNQLFFIFLNDHFSFFLKKILGTTISSYITGQKTKKKKKTAVGDKDSLMVNHRIANMIRLNLIISTSTSRSVFHFLGEGS